ncbi:MAG: hypothetical protein A3E01_11665 [Gammaproteobacteria bacterium RIFCSPHIGHO2_12_FULL_63_22]|nr:MAG: hypothetical protein A3E01_11665 [Gammaproteobacteria bacterium RIFCSPHIGHO2_12_FULL_63_22]
MNHQQARIDAGLALLVGLAAFLLFCDGGAILDPTYTDWLMVGDPASGWLGWQFFRETPWLQWPLGANPNYGAELGSAIVFSDSIPLLAFFFKPFEAWLPQSFQYFGLWLAGCFMLQAFFGWKLLKLLSTDRWVPLLGAAFFAISPILTMRLFGHYALTAHWLILAGLYLYMRPEASARYWIALLGIAALVHAYLLLFLLALFGADLVQRAWLGQRDWRQSATCLVVAAGVVIGLMWATGYFMLGGIGGVGVGNEPYGRYHMNLHALLDSENLYSRIVLDRKGGPGDYEGFAFFGTGMLLLAVAALPSLLERRVSAPLARWLPITLAAVGFIVVALSNRIALGQTELFHYPLPDLVSPLTSAFRVSGRFIWPVYYLAYLAIFFLIATRMRAGTARVLLLGMLVFQIVDSAYAWRHFSVVLARDQAWTSPMQSPVWTRLATQYRKISVMRPHNNSKEWIALADFASRHHMATQAGSFARVQPEREAQARAQAERAVMQQAFEDDVLYVFEDDDLWRLVLSQPQGQRFLGTINGFRVMAPKGCAHCTPAEIRPESGAGAAGLSFGETVAFNAGSKGAGLLASGWSGNEPWGTWSSASSAVVVLDLGEMPTTDIILMIKGSAYLAPKHPFQEIAVFVNDQSVAELRYEAGGETTRRVRVPQAVAAARDGRLVLRFEFRNPASPASVGASADDRLLGLGLESIQVQAAD